MTRINKYKSIEAAYAFLCFETGDRLTILKNLQNLEQHRLQKPSGNSLAKGLSFQEVETKNKHPLKAKQRPFNQSQHATSALKITEPIKTTLLPSKPKVIQSRFSSITSDQKRRTTYHKQELKNLILKAVVHSTALVSVKPSKTKAKGQAGFTKLKSLRRFALMAPIYRRMHRRIGTMTRLKNRCVLTGHPVAIGKLGISRIMLRSLAGFGQLPGFVKI